MYNHWDIQEQACVCVCACLTPGKPTDIPYTTIHIVQPTVQCLFQSCLGGEISPKNSQIPPTMLRPEINNTYLKYKFNPVYFLLC